MTQYVLPETKLRSLAREWLAEDCPSFDFGGFVIGSKIGEAQLLCKSSCILSGVPFFNAIFEELDCNVKWHYSEGESFLSDPNTEFKRVKVATVHGPIKNILLGERPALNVLSRSSGIATMCQTYIGKAVKKKLRHGLVVELGLLEYPMEIGWKGRIAGTRKTTPGFRLVEKYSLLVGGVDTHRYDLSSMVMLKDNHIWSAGNIEKTVKRVLELCSFSTKVEVECQNISEGLEAAGAGAHVVMFDNQTPGQLHAAAKHLKESYPHVIVECSGGIDEGNIEEYFGEYVDVISTSKLVQGYSCADFSLKIIKESVTDF